MALMSPPTEAVGQARRRRGRSALPAALTLRVEVLEQLVCRELDLLVPRLRGSVRAGDQPHPVDPTEVAVEQGSGRPKSCGLYRATEIARIFGRTVRRSSLRDISPLTVLSLVASLADRAGRGGEVRADCGRGHRPGPGSSVPGSTAPSRRAGPMPRTTSCGAASTAPPGSTPNWSACSTAPPSTSPTRCRDAPTMRKAFRHHAGRRDCRALRWRDRG